MEKQIAQFTNRGMYQDTSISKATNEFAFENINIRITPLNDNTLFSIINEKEPKELNVILDNGKTVILGNYLGHCVLNDYIVLFTKGDNDYIYRLQYDEIQNVLTGTVLYEGKLEFNSKIECIGYYESENIQKVYWVDNDNYPRVINIKNTYNNDDSTQFDFNPEISIFPTINVTKEYKNTGVFPAGVIQYFVSYYNKHGIETPILASSDINYIDNTDRGSSPEDILKCSFKINIDDIDTSYDYLRLYSVKRTSYNGDIQFNIVKDINIKNQSSINIIDNNTNQSSLDPNLLFFIGGKEFYASTIAQKDNTLFFGNIKLADNPVDESLVKLINNTIKDNNGIKESSLVIFGNKTITLGDTKGFYTYERQSVNSSTEFKTFKSAEIYRFAIQFQTKRGEWTSPIWVGDKICDVYPVIDETTKLATVANPVCTLTPEIINAASNYKKYRLLMADASQDRTIVAQGVVCPTVFNYEERLDNKVYSLSSWIMRPRGGNASWQHMSSTSDEIQGTNSLAPVVNDGSGVSTDGDEPILFTSKIIYLHPYPGHGCAVAVRRGRYINNNPPTWDESKISYLIKSANFKNGSWKTTYEEVRLFIATHTAKDLETDLGVTFEKFKKFAKQELSNVSEAKLLGDSWIDFDFLKYSSIFNNDKPNGDRGYAYTVIVEEDETIVNNKLDINIQTKKNNFYVDNSLVTFHSPDIEYNTNIFKNNNLNFRIVGIVPITSNYSDANIELNTKGLSSAYNINKDNIINNSNISKTTKTLISNLLYRDFDWEYTVDGNTGFGGYLPTSNLIDYNIYMWHKQGSLIGQNEETYNTTNGNSFDNIIADLKKKTFATQRFSYNTVYLEPWESFISPTQYFDSNNIEYLQVELSKGNKIFYSGNYDKLLTFTNEYYVNNLKSFDPVRIKYKSTPHVVFSLWADKEASKLNTLPWLKEENENFSEIYGVNTNPSYPWQINKLSKKSKIKTLGFYHFPNTTLTDNDVQNIFNIIKTHYIGENKINHILYGETTTLYLFLCNMLSNAYLTVGYPNPGCLTGIIKFETTNNILTIGNVKYSNSISDFPELIGLQFDLCELTNGNSIDGSYNLMPSFEDYKQGTIIEFYKDTRFDNYTFKYIEKDIDYNLKDITEYNSDGYSYLYLAELYKDLDYHNLYGGYDEKALEAINWLPITNSVNIETPTGKAEGDTYFQRWDCLKTYPYTEEDINSVVDITSFMVETHINLESRYDKNIGTTNILNIRPQNFNLTNKVYNQENNIFSYNILDSKYYNKVFNNQITWSLSKTNTENIDTWTNISLASTLNLNGSYGKITKLINNNDTILAFQDKAISAINFNNRTALSTENGIPIEIANSGKVDGYKVITDTVGCQDKQLMVKGNSGLYFIDKYNKSLFSINSEGLKNISNKGMSVWFKNNIDKIKYLNYSSSLQDIYITTDTLSLLFNENLNNFTSFLNFINHLNTNIVNYKGESYCFKDTEKVDKESSSCTPIQLSVGNYTNDYKISYRINPEPYLDKVFTNIEYIAELYNKDNRNISANPFGSITVENDYQYGETSISNVKYPNFTKKFRIWRTDIPRDQNSKHKLDRIRNPWINLSLYSNKDASLTNSKLEFHNLNVYYYK